MKFFGIDLGTSTCSVSYAVNSFRPNYIPQPVVVEFRVDQLQGTKSSAVPSVVVRLSHRDQGDAKQPTIGQLLCSVSKTSAGPEPGDTLFGFEAEKALDTRQVQGRNGHDVFRSVKSHLGT